MVSLFPSREIENANVISGVLGLVAYPGQGLVKSIRSAVKSKTRKVIATVRHEEGQCLLKGPAGQTVNQAEVVRMFDYLMSKE